MIINRVWCMPNHETFSIKPIDELLRRWIKTDDFVIDPFSRNSRWAAISNDLNPDTNADYHMDAIDFLDMLIQQRCMADVVLFDPPYSPRQITECYASVGIKATQADTQASFYTKLKDRLHTILKPSGVAICFGWNSNGMGKTRGYTIEEILLVPHGGAHNDTIVTVERKSE